MKWEQERWTSWNPRSPSYTKLRVRSVSHSTLAERGATWNPITGAGREGLRGRPAPTLRLIASYHKLLVLLPGSTDHESLELLRVIGNLPRARASWNLPRARASWKEGHRAPVPLTECVS